MIEAMYGVEFVSNQMSSGYGVAVLETGRILGGDTSFVYIGSYEVKNGIAYANVKCTNDRDVLESVFGDLKEFNLELQGAVSDREFTLQGHMVEDPSFSIGIKLTRRAELP
jgi:hypothetical protein